MAKLTPIKAIRNKCLECSCDSYNEVELCPVKECPLYEYRFGVRPPWPLLSAGLGVRGLIVHELPSTIHLEPYPSLSFIDYTNGNIFLNEFAKTTLIAEH